MCTHRDKNVTLTKEYHFLSYESCVYCLRVKTIKKKKAMFIFTYYFRAFTIRSKLSFSDR